ncbi:aminopeptidase [Synoicihabitans lomoniglobus]|uniref:Aminopeptidase n=1 Tax=Synoicihabitans lomoniglobus TaxID=2909285 RepID=A0AAF0CS85_9BACT|nr:aminopeptidase [Opitutaceae bacterium LMO-M01]WED67041.1 aminopeptidase [Opitutaceae bacterium LMO-M01]
MIIDPRYNDLAAGLTGFSTKLKRGERVLIDAFDVPDAVVIALVRAARARGAVPYVQIHRARITRELMLKAEVEHYEPHAAVELQRMQDMDAYIALRGSENIFENSDVPSARVQKVAKAMKPVLDHRVNKTKWVVLRWPTSAMAQQAAMSTEAFEDFYFRVCTLDYSRMIPGMRALNKLMSNTDKVEIKGPGTDLKFSIKGIGACSCGGDRNIPDGEVFSCPVKDSVEGVIQYNAPTVYLGSSFDGIRLEFSQGKVIKATAGTPKATKRLNQILDSDAGARYIGEFAIGFNPHILEPMRDILFDEKIAGSFHFTPGQAYGHCGNGNNSQVHWDMVCIQRPEWGGGEIWFDGKLIRKDGLFVPKSLEKLNPDYLLGKA